MGQSLGQAVGYIRVSTDEQSLSMVAQGERITAWCQAQGLDLTAIYFEQGVCGGMKDHEDDPQEALDRRPALLAALAALRPGMVLVALHRDRIARDVMLSTMLKKLVARKHAAIRTCDGVSNGDTPHEHLFHTIVDAFAEYERQIIRARTKTALQQKKRQGERISGRAPYGYRFTDIGTVVPDDAEQAVIAAARQYAEGGLSLRQIAARLASDGHLSRVGKPFTVSTVRTMLRTVA